MATKSRGSAGSKSQGGMQTQEVQSSDGAGTSRARTFADSDTASTDQDTGTGEDIKIISGSLERSDRSAPPADRNARIAEAAYRRAERRGFAPGCELEDWLEAEREIDGTAARQTRPEDQFTG